MNSAEWNDALNRRGMWWCAAADGETATGNRWAVMKLHHAKQDAGVATDWGVFIPKDLQGYDLTEMVSG